MADNTEAILAAIGALDEKFDKRFGELKKADEHHVEELQRLGSEQRALRKDVDELRSETKRTFDAERHAIKATTDAIVEHVDKSAKAFQEKAADIEALKAETAQQSAELAKQTAILTRLDAVAANPMVRRVAYLIGLAIAGWLASKGIK